MSSFNRDKIDFVNKVEEPSIAIICIKPTYYILKYLLNPPIQQG
jgi:hypothetical protein